MNAVKLLARRGLRAHRAAWAAVFAAVLLASALLGASALTIGSAALGHGRADRYAAADLVVAGDQTTRHSAKPWGGERQHTSAALTERVRLPEHTVGVVHEVDGVRAAIADRLFPLTLETGPGPGRARTAEGRPWAAASLAPYALREGRPPRHAAETVAGAGLGVRTGERIVVRAAGHARTHQVVGVADGPAALYFTPARARLLAGNPTTVDAVGVLAEPGVPVEELHARIRGALDRAETRDTAAGKKPRLLTGDGRGAPEHLDAAPARDGLIAMVAAVSGTVLLVVVLVLGSLVAQALRQRSAELALLRSVGAGAAQIRAAVGREVGAVATAAALVGALAAIPAHLALQEWLRGRGVLPAGLELPTPWWLCPAVLLTAGLTVGAARLAVLFARPGAPSRDKPPGDARRITGLVLLIAGVSTSVTATLQSGGTAAALVSTAVVTMVAGCAVLGPWIARGALRLLGAPLRRLGGPAGKLAAAACTAEAARLGAAITPLVLMAAFASVQLSAGATMQRAGDLEAERALRAQYAVTGADAARLRALPGVATATEVLRSTVVLAGTEAGSPRLERLPVLGVTPAGLSRTLDPGWTAGDPAGLGRAGTVAVGERRAKSLEVRPGSQVTVRMGDGAERRLTVAAVYRDSLGLGDFLFSAAELSRHLSSPLPARVLIAPAPGADPAALRAAVGEIPGARLDTAPAPERPVSEEQRAGAALSLAAVASIGALTAVAVLTTLALITTGRRPELALLRRVGAGRAQLRRMLRAEAVVVIVTGLAVGAAVAAVPLLAFAATAAGTLPHLPAAHAGAIALATVAVAYAGSLAPARRALKR
ncbi:ABC transporter permease [Streptomyces inusitatus]|uniref:ABC transporter permease n=1 Tax=Streptomyces inusitatus TaxID=68221 RepID=A0A918PMI8_9ACTN|nr:FtsX-like permease family protein [Streptomyces inusitatus]GGZ14832.1 ABC transporter permease [Streptomyces inusitatus]